MLALRLGQAFSYQRSAINPQHSAIGFRFAIRCLLLAFSVASVAAKRYSVNAYGHGRPRL